MGACSWPLHGLFNARNAAMAALSAALATDHQDPLDFDLSSLLTFKVFAGVRMCSIRMTSWTIVEDFAHHPTAVEGAIEALRAAYPNRKMTVCFEPRSNTAASARFRLSFNRHSRVPTASTLERSIGQIVCVQRNDWIQLEWRMR